MSSRRTMLLKRAILASALIGVGGTAFMMLSVRRREHVVAESVPRLHGSTATLPQVQSVRAFAIDRGQLFLLDPLEHRVHVAKVEAEGIAYVGAFGREGGGPGELVQPSGIALWPGDTGVVIADQGRLHIFTRDGHYRETLAPRPPCGMALPQVARGVTGVFLYGDCLRRGPPDTMAAVLTWSADGREFRIIASDARISMDGEYGNIFGTRNAFAGGSSHDLFGSGVGPCLYAIDPVAGRDPLARPQCDVAGEAFPLHLRKATREMLEQGRSMTSKRQRLPSNHPSYSAMLTFAGDDYLLRSYSEDSLVLRAAGGLADLAVIPMPGLVGCSREGCLRAVPQMSGTQLTFYPAAAFVAAARSGS